MRAHYLLILLFLSAIASCKKDPQPETAKLTSVDSIRFYFVPGETVGVGKHYMLTRSDLRQDTTATAFQPDAPYTVHTKRGDADFSRMVGLLDRVPERIFYTENAKYVDAFNCVDAAVVYIEAYQGGKGHTWVADECTDDMQADAKAFTDEVFGFMGSL